MWKRGETISELIHNQTVRARISWGQKRAHMMPNEVQNIAQSSFQMVQPP
jgi:hypothetical protein